MRLPAGSAIPVPARSRSPPQPGAQAAIQPASSRTPPRVRRALGDARAAEARPAGPGRAAVERGRLGGDVGADAVEDHVVDERGRPRRDPRRGDEAVCLQLRVEEEAAVVVGAPVRRGRAIASAIESSRYDSPGASLVLEGGGAPTGVPCRAPPGRTS